MNAPLKDQFVRTIYTFKAKGFLNIILFQNTVRCFLFWTVPIYTVLAKMKAYIYLTFIILKYKCISFYPPR
jgi:hypothetical protein